MSSFGAIPPLIQGDVMHSDGVFTGSVAIKGGLRTTSTHAVVSPTTFSASGSVSVADLLNGMVGVTSSGVTLTLPAAADLVAALQGPSAHSAYELNVFANPANIVTVSAGTDGVLVGAAATPATVVNRLVTVVLTNVTAGTEAYNVY